VTTPTSGYAARLDALQGARWKRRVPNPYRAYLRHLRLGRTLEVGCGIGRNLGYLGGFGIGVDTDPDAVARCRRLGFHAYLAEEFTAAPRSFDTLLVSHVLEHLSHAEAGALLSRYLGYVRPGGRVVVITPQERGFASDATHRRFTGFDEVRSLLEDRGLAVERQRSFPLPRPLGRWFVYNEFVTLARVP